MTTSVAEKTPGKIWTFDPSEFRQLYHQQKWDALSESLLEVLKHFEEVTYFELTLGLEQRINTFVHEFLYLFTRPDYTLNDDQIKKFLRLNGIIADLVAISQFKTTDPWLYLLEQQPNHLLNFAKRLILYSSRNHREYSIKELFDISPYLTSLWYCHSFMHYGILCANRHAKQRLQNWMKAFDRRLEPLIDFQHMNFGATYIDGEGERLFKSRINSKIKELYARHISIQNNPNPRRIGVISGRWFHGSSVYRILRPFVKALQESYEVVLYHFTASHLPLDTEGFVAVHRLEWRNGELDISSLLENDLMVVYYPDIGMDTENLLLSNLRLAPIQIMGYGHPVSAFGAEIDYLIGGAVVEPYEAWQHYNERLVLLTGLGQSCIRPDYEPQYPAPSSDPLVINCSWACQKVNSHLLELLQEILRRTQHPLLFQIFGGPLISARNQFIPFVKDLEAFLPRHSFQVIPPKAYSEYMAMMERGAFALDSYPFGGGNTIVDSLVIGKPIIAYEGQRWYNRIGAALLREVGLEELVARSDREYVEKALKLIQDKDYRQQLSRRLRESNLDRLLFHGLEAPLFRQAIDYLIANHETLKQSGSRAPILIEPSNQVLHLRDH